MRSEDIVRQAVDKALKNGWRLNGFPDHTKFDVDFTGKDITFMKWEEKLQDGPGWTARYKWDAYRLIFNHDFARALWGKSLVHNNYKGSEGVDVVIHREAWQYHLQQMVIAEDPIRYLGDHI
jgi:hypothetical protein